MGINKQIAFGWVIGYFVAMFPFWVATDGDLVFGLLNGIIGVLGAILLMEAYKND